MDKIGICRLCGAKICYHKEDIRALGAHLLEKHPDLEMTHFESPEDARSKFSSSSSSSSNTRTKFKKSCNRSLASVARACGALSTASGSMFKNKSSKGGATNKKQYYKTTVESWFPGSDSIECPKCGAKDQPYIRKRKNKVAYNSLGAYFLLTCWPLCFCPLVMLGNGSTTTICCRKCGFCFGTYNKKTGKLIPNTKEETIPMPDLCDSSDDAQPPTRNTSDNNN